MKKNKRINNVQFDVVIFDCDGVLVDSEIISAQTLLSEAQALGVSIDMPYILKNYVGSSFPTVLSDIEHHFEVTLPKNFEDNYRTHLLSVFERELAVIPGVLEVINELSVPYCVATSSSPRRVKRSLELVGLDRVFADKVFTASQVKNGKPAPDLFLFACEQMGANPLKSLVIEDSEPGVAAGLATGMTTARFMGGAHLHNLSDKSGACLTFDKFADFFDYFPNIKRNT